MIYYKRLGQSDQSTSLITGKTKKMLCDEPLMSHKWPVPLTHTFMSTTHTHVLFLAKLVPLCLSICSELSYKSPPPPPFAFRQWACILFPEPKGLCSLLSQTYLRGDQVVHMYASVFQCVCMWEMCACVCPLPIPTPAGFFAKINLPVDDSEILQESHPEGEWANTSAMLLHQWAEQMNERQWERWREKKGSANGP